MTTKRVWAGDVQLHVRVEGEGEPLLLVHGFPLDHTMWEGQIGELSQEALVVAPDLRGFGHSDASPGTVTMQQFADDLALLLDQLGVRHSVTLCGLSMGGYIAWQFLARHGRRLKRLILCDTRAAADTADAARQRRETADEVLQKGPQLLADSMPPKLFAESSFTSQPEIIESTRKVILKTDPRGIAAALWGMAERPDATGLLRSIHIPALLICGQHDAITPMEEMRAMAGVIPAAQLVEIPAAGHMAPLERPREVNNAIRRFLHDTAASP